MDSEYDIFSNRIIYNSSSKSKTNRIETLHSKAVHLRLILEKDIKAADFKWSLFIAAAINFKYETCLKPYPPGFLKNDSSKDMDKLLMIIADIPSLDIVLQKLDLNKTEQLTFLNDMLDLLFYVIVRLKEPIIKFIPPEMHDSVLSLVNPNVSGAKPQYIFQVISSDESTAECKWKEMAKHKNIFYAFHGNKLENFYSILHFGLQLNLNKNKSTDNGIYLSREIGGSLSHSGCGYGWGASCLGGHLSCVALCEVIDAPNGINYQKPTCEGDKVYEYSTSNSYNTPNIDSQYVVTDCDLIRVRYLLVYAKQSSAFSRIRNTSIPAQDTGESNWFSKHKLFSILIGYGLMLATIGFANNHPVNYYYQILMKQLDMAYNKFMT